MGRTIVVFPGISLEYQQAFCDKYNALLKEIYNEYVSQLDEEQMEDPPDAPYEMTPDRLVLAIGYGPTYHVRAHNEEGTGSTPESPFEQILSNLDETLESWLDDR